MQKEISNETIIYTILIESDIHQTKKIYTTRLDEMFARIDATGEKMLAHSYCKFADFDDEEKKEVVETVVR